MNVYLSLHGLERGLGQALYKVLITQLKNFGFHTLIGIVTTPNPASARLHRACSFKLVDKLRDIGKNLIIGMEQLFINLLLIMKIPSSVLNKGTY